MLNNNLLINDTLNLTVNFLDQNFISFFLFDFLNDSKTYDMIDNLVDLDLNEEYYNLFWELKDYQLFYNKFDLVNTLNSTTNTINTDKNPLSLYTFSVPNMKIFYPEPFIATGNFSHTDLWFIHISIYQYWLWFFFIYLIIFFTLSFLVTLRWCNVRNKPQRETRGVSRSKCGDLITAVIPVTWAGSIIVHESTDAVDFYDGFGTSEMAVGVRAYQWGWEYYYPKDIDILYLTSNFNNEFAGKSLYYTQENEEYGKTAAFIEHHKIKNNFDASITPAHLICFSTGFNDTLNLATSKNFGYAKLIKDNTFKHVLSSRYINYNLNLNYLSKNDLFSKKQGLFQFLNIDTNIVTKPKLHTKQHEYLSLADLYKIHSSFYDLKPLYKYLELNQLEKPQPNFNNLTLNSCILNKFLNTTSFKLLYDKINYIFYTSNIKNNSITYLNLANKNTNLDSNFTHKYNILNLPVSSNIYNLSNINVQNNFLKFNNLNNIFTSIINSNINLDYNNLINSTNNIHSYLKTPFKPSNLNLMWLNTYNTEIALLKQVDSWNNDFFFIDFISKFFKNSFNNIKFLAQLNNIKLLSTFNLFIPNQYSELESKRNPTFETLEDMLFTEYELCNFNENEECDYTVEFLMSSITLKEHVMSGLKYTPEQFQEYYENEEKEFTDEFDEKGKESIDDFEFNTLKDYLIKDEKAHLDYELDLNLTNEILNNENCITDYLMKLNINYNWNPVILTKLNNIDFNFTNNLNLQYLTNYDYLNKIISNSFNNYKELQFLYTKLNLNVFNNFNIFKFINDPATLITSFWNNNENNNLTSLFSKITNKFNINLFKFTFDYSLLDSIKSMNQFETAIWRFYRNSFDVNKSFINFDNFSTSYIKIPYINTFTGNFKKYINKNYISFIKSNLYLSKLNSYVNTNHSLFNSTMIFTYNFPFSLANESDVLKYMWFDWYSNYNKRIAKQLDISDYIVNGVKVYKHKYDFALNDVNKYNIKDNYLSRLSHSRKNYQPVWNYTPFILNTFKNWTKDYTIFMNLVSLYNLNSLNSRLVDADLDFWLTFMKWFDELYININNYSLASISLTNSGILTPSRNFWRSVNTLSSYTYFISSLSDILTKREYLFKQLLNYYNVNINNFKTYNVSPMNTIFLNWKSNLLKYSNIELKIIEENKLYEDILKLNIITKNLTYVYQKYFYLIDNYYLLVNSSINWNYFKIIENYLNLLKINEHSLIDFKNFINFNTLFNLTSEIQNNYLLNNDKIFYKKTQYKHMRKSMANMIRIQNDKAVAMPVDTRIQFLTVSKDIIHSWAIPSAGIKIDCIPGYSSHKVTVFFLSGIYWGQCMEICGRYHHWMPIVVYFMKRDLFLLWCMHFVSVNKTANHATSAQIVNNNTDTNYVVSYPLSSWKNELN